ncbi:Uncharacterised protein [Vibrio cholerae]|nr:Uncharacterised protein [Vibrio cholerae]
MTERGTCRLYSVIAKPNLVENLILKRITPIPMWLA